MRSGYGMTMFRSRIAPAAALVLALAARGAARAEVFEQVLVKVNGEIITKTEFEQRQVAELRNRPELGNVSPDEPAAAERDRRNHAGSDPHGGRRAAAHPARPRARLHDGRRAVQQHPRQHQEAEQPRRRAEVPGGAEAGRDDDGRPAAEPRTEHARVAGAARRGHRQDQRQRRGSARLLRGARARFHHAVGADAARAADRSAGQRPRHQRRPGRRGQGQGRGPPQAAARRRAVSRAWRPSSRRPRRRPTAA